MNNNKIRSNNRKKYRKYTKRISNRKLISKDEKTKGKETKNKLRRHIRRLSIRKQITYTQAILHFYNAKSLYEIDKNLLFSLFKNDMDLKEKI